MCSVSALPMTAVGWLGGAYGVQGGAAAPLTAAELRLLQAASIRVGSLALGWHECEFCSAVEGNGEYRYYLPNGVIHAAPTMIVHYAERHGYRPPAEFVERPIRCDPAAVGLACRTPVLTPARCVRGLCMASRRCRRSVTLGRPAGV
jgi:hypothetical protein